MSTTEDPATATTGTDAPDRPPRVYLAGPIDNVTDDEATGWRDRAQTALAEDCEVVDPYARQPDWPADERGQRVLRAWCLEQARQCDAVLVGSLDPAITSRGTSMEIREAERADTPVIVHSPAPAEVSPFVTLAAESVHADLAGAIEAVRACLGLLAAAADGGELP